MVILKAMDIKVFRSVDERKKIFFFREGRREVGGGAEGERDRKNPEPTSH